MKTELKTGVKAVKSITVTKEVTADAVGSGLLPVFSTPALIALMEGTCAESVSGYLDDGCGTVGTSIEVRHTSATPIGMTVTCESELTGIDRRRLTFHVVARDEAGEIGEGVHERFIVDNARFMEKANSKLTEK